MKRLKIDEACVRHRLMTTGVTNSPSEKGSMIKTLSLITLIAVPFYFAFPMCGGTGADSDSIAFFRAINDKSRYVKDQGRYRRITVKELSGDHQYYVERKPAHVIPASAVESVIVRKSKKYGSSREETAEAVRETSGGKAPQTFPRGFFYNVSFKIKAPEGQKFSVFTDRNKLDLFEPRIGRRTLSLLQFDLPFEPDDNGSLEFTVYLQEEDLKKLETEMLTPFKGKIKWE